MYQLYQESSDDNAISRLAELIGLVCSLASYPFELSLRNPFFSLASDSLVSLASSLNPHLFRDSLRVLGFSLFFDGPQPCLFQLTVHVCPRVEYIGPADSVRVKGTE